MGSAEEIRAARESPERMAGTTVTPTVGGGFTGKAAIAGQHLSAAAINSYRVAAVAERLTTHFCSGQVNDPKEFFNLCLSLARGIDYAVANNQVPETIRNIPLLLKKVCQHRNDLFLQAAIMVLMISVKNACKTGWFSEKETEELLTLSNEIGRSFCSPGGMSTAANDCLATISTIMRRFYPLMKMGQILASLEVKPGYGAHVTDFNISKQTTHSAEEKIRLFVAEKDNIDTSTCIISPQLVNFLLNGKPVDRRTNVSMDPGPQLPTNVTSMLKYGTNLLQAVGQFNGHYIIVVAFMSVTPSPDIPVLQDYIEPVIASLDPDSDIIEGPSRISLNCPISYKRIKTPVKGLSCKHLQCFDYSNFVDINSRRPSWRCPHCNQFVCYPDLRVDQNMVKVLKEVGDTVHDVIISADGSWKAIMETDDNVDKPRADSTSEQQEPSTIDTPVTLDLTEDTDDEMAAADIYEIEDIKPFQTNIYTHPGLSNLNGVNQNVVPQVEDAFWSGLYLAANALEDAQVAAGSTSQPCPANSSSPNNLQLQESQLDSLIRNEYGRSSLIPGHLSRTPVAIQALPAQPQSPNLQQRPRPGVSSPITNSSGLASQAPSPRAPTANERPQQPSRSHMNASRVMPGGCPASSSQLPGAYRASSAILSEFQNSHLQQAFNRRVPPQPPSPSPSLARTSSQVPHTEQAKYAVAAQRAAAQMTRQSQAVPVQIHTTRTVTSSSVNAESVPGTDGIVDVPYDENWRPTGRMRGSLQGSAYSAALNQFMMQATHPAQSTRPNLTTPLPIIPDLPSVLVADSRVSEPARKGGSGTQPERSHGIR